MVTLFQQMLSQIKEVVNLTVEYDTPRPVLVENRLVTRREIYDAQSSVPQQRVGIPVMAAVVRPSVGKGKRSLLQKTFIKRTASRNYSENAAHRFNLP